ncbi:3-methyl-2-oxobutanoate hydroxymethyltransferase [Tsukamurella sp. 8F]|uniref:3-methyl-2-oxobutanoate hydroxymethyltransferase n=1 Tax=unclassified Tsukamurella TaxID=2633480 RepID=UPI0023B91CBC|nr:MULTISPECIES: 3-methyl-2-oxobutanoate hydroxymethyltransferase [unclassified Tsukamurella]MDF0529943.1 3-methyl-2-oxobutanoate hydroxymethyltransferase [Tsukamurella sp. 8J]MDF0587285.1 3-methyl-2-oxobutanoate hydroxymethyltransferase [Tsukamurella sp. 8F]
MTESPVYGGGDQAEAPRRKKVRIHHLAEMRGRGERFAMLTSYDYLTAQTFDAAGVPVLLIGDSAANVVFGHDSTLPVGVDVLAPLVSAVRRGAAHALVVADLPFGSYEKSPEQAFDAASTMMKAGAEAVKIEGGVHMAPTIEFLTARGIPVMAHIGFTPQSVNTLGGNRVQGRGDSAQRILADARAVDDAGAFSVVLEMVPADVAKRVTESGSIPTIGIGAGLDCDGQVLVWQDMAGLSRGRVARFVKRYADVGDQLERAAAQYVADVASGAFPGEEHSF